MKARTIRNLIMMLALTVSANYAQQEFTFTTTLTNISSSRARIDKIGLANNPIAIIIGTPLYDPIKTTQRSLGVWYYNDQWNIFNTDHATMPPGLKFKLEVYLRPDANHFLHIITNQNLGQEGSYFDHPLINNNPDSQFKILQNHAPSHRTPFYLNQNEAKVVYNSASGKWFIKNVNGNPLRPNMAYNVVIYPEGRSGLNAPLSTPIPAPIVVATRTRMPIISTGTIPTTPTSLPTTSPQPEPVRTRTRMPIISTTAEPILASPTVQPAPSPGPMPIPTRTRMPIIPTETQLSTTSSTDSCTKEAAYQTIGKWGKQKLDDLAMADRNFPKTQYKPVLAKAQKVIELFRQANPEFKGIEANAKRGIRGESYFPNGALPFRIDVGYDSYICVGNDTYKVKMRGKIILYGNYGYTTINFNSFGNVLESLQDGKPFLTAEGEEIFEFNKQLGEFKGFPMIQPATRDEDKHEAIIIAPDNRLPYKHVTREQFLLASIKFYESQSGSNAAEIAGIKKALGNMSATERQAPAFILNGSFPASTGRRKLFATEAEGGKPLVTINRSFFNPNLPRDVIQFITVHWSWDDKITPKAEMIRQFKQNFNFEALRQMLGK